MSSHVGFLRVDLCSPGILTINITFFLRIAADPLKLSSTLQFHLHCDHKTYALLIDYNPLYSTLTLYLFYLWTDSQSYNKSRCSSSTHLILDWLLRLLWSKEKIKFEKETCNTGISCNLYVSAQVWDAWIHFLNNYFIGYCIEYNIYSENIIIAFIFAAVGEQGHFAIFLRK